MTEEPEKTEEPREKWERIRNEPSVLALVLRGIGIIVGAFISASIILFLHIPFGH
jgi:hypothetical protein